MVPQNAKTTQIEFVSEFQTQRKDSAQILAFTDAQSCENHPSGVFIGLMCEKKPEYACEGLKLVKNIEANKPITLKVEYKFGDITTWKIGGCNVQMSFTPSENSKYRALYKVNEKSCSVVLLKSGPGGSWVKDTTVSYDKNMCIWS